MTSWVGVHLPQNSSKGNLAQYNKRSEFSPCRGEIVEKMIANLQKQVRTMRERAILVST